MRKIALPNNQYAVVDDRDYNKLNRYNWCCDSKSYAMRVSITNGKRKTILMHRQILGAKRGQVIDHINRKTLDNRQSNLRFCTTSQNKANGKIYANNLSGFKGVYRDRSKWRSQIRVKGELFDLGTFLEKVEAAKAYNKAATRYFGEFASLNSIST